MYPGESHVRLKPCRRQGPEGTRDTTSQALHQRLLVPEAGLEEGLKALKLDNEALLRVAPGPGRDFPRTPPFVDAAELQLPTPMLEEQQFAEDAQEQLSVDFELGLVQVKSHLLAGMHFEAQQQMQIVENSVDVSENTEYQARLHFWKGVVCLKLGDADEARQHMMEAHYKYRQLPLSLWQSMCTSYSARLWKELDRKDRKWQSKITNAGPKRKQVDGTLQRTKRPAEVLALGVF